MALSFFSRRWFDRLARLVRERGRPARKPRPRPARRLVLESLEDRTVLSPTVPAGYEITALASGGPLAGQHLAGIVADPKSGNVYVAADQQYMNGNGDFASSFNLYRITPAGVVSFVGSYNVPHVDLVKMAINPADGDIYFGNYQADAIDKIDPTSPAPPLEVFSSGGIPFNGYRYGLNFDSSGNLIFSPEEDFDFYLIKPGSGSEFLGTTNPEPPNFNHGDSFGIQPNGNYVVYSDLCSSPMNNYALNTAGHVPGSNYSIAWVGTTDLHTIYNQPDQGLCGYSDGAIDPSTGDVYSITSNFGRGISAIAFTPASGGASSAFVSGIGNGQLDPSAQGVTDLSFGSRTDGLPGESLFFLDTYTNTVYEVDSAVPTFSSLASPTISYGTSSTELSGHIAAGSSIPSGNVSITVGNVTETAAIDPNSGDFSVVFPTSTLAASATPYTITYAYSSTANFGVSTSATGALTVNPATPQIAFGGNDYNSTSNSYSFTYDGQAHGASATVAGVDGVAAASLENVSPTLDYQQLDANGNVVQDLGGTAPTDSGSYRVTASFAGSADYTSASALANFTIAQASSTIASLSPVSAVYDGSAHGVTAPAVTGAGGLNTTATLDYVQDNADGTTTDLRSNAPVHAGSYTVTASYAGDSNHTAAASISTTITIGQATPSVPTPTVPSNAVYNGQPQGATVSDVTGVNNTDLGAPTLTYYSGTYTLSNLPSSGGSSTAPTNADSYTVVARYVGSTDYKSASSIATYSIAKATTALSNLTVQQITLGTNTTTLSGQLTSNTIVPVGQSVSITLNGVTHSATVGTDGAFSVNFTTGAMGGGQYNITYSYPGDDNFTAASGTGKLTVDYGTKLLFDNSKVVHPGSVLPVKLELTDAGGTDVSSASIAVTAASLVGPGGAAAPLHYAGSANTNNVFRYDPSLGGYIFNLDTAGLTSGTYTLYYTAGNDPTPHSLTFVVG